jgi:hypothetical protein
MIRATAVAVGSTADVGMPMALSGVRSSVPIEGWAM